MQDERESRSRDAGPMLLQVFFPGWTVRMSKVASFREEEETNSKKAQHCLKEEANSKTAQIGLVNVQNQDSFQIW